LLYIEKSRCLSETFLN